MREFPENPATRHAPEPPDNSATSRAAEPPRLALRLLDRRLPEAHRESLIGDLAESFAERAMRDGQNAARRWFWRQTALALLHFAVHRPPRVPEPTGDPAMTSFLANVRFGARMLRRSPAFTLLCVLTLGLGIGATTAIFSIVNPILLRPLPYDGAERVVTLWERDPQGRSSNTTFATYTDVRSAARSLENAAVVGGWEINLAADGTAEHLEGLRVSSSYFRTLGVRPMLGRDFVPDEDVPGRNRVVILSYGLWAERLGADSGVVGRTIALDGAQYTVVGVMPRDFDDVVSPRSRIYRVLGYSADQSWACRTCRHLRMIARVKPGVPVATASAELQQIMDRLVAQYPKEYAASGMNVVPLQDQVTGRVRPVLFAVLGAVALVLLIAIANVTSLQLARAIRREEEFAIRIALGAGRARLTSQLLAEGMLLAFGGGIAGLVVAALTLPALLARLPENIPRLASVRLDGEALALASLVTLGLGLVVGLVPAWRSERATLAGVRAGRRIAGGGRSLARASLVVTEIALALMLMMGAALLSRSLVKLLSVEPGFDPEHLLTMTVQATGPRYQTDADVWANHDRVIESVRAIPGVLSAAITNQLPLGGGFDSYGFHAQDRPLDNPELAPNPDRYVVSTDYLSAMRIPVLRGRGFEPSDDRADARPVGLVSAALAQRIWPGEDAVGKRFRVGDPNGPWREVVGVVGDVHHRGLDDAATNQFYVPQRQWMFSDAAVVLVVRTKGDPAAIAPQVREAVRGIDPTQPIVGMATMDDVIARSTGQRRLALVLFGAFAGLAALLAGAGIFGVLATRVAERTREIGVRTALGATPGRILALVTGQGATLVVLGGTSGVLGTLALARYLGTLLYGIEPTDPATLVLVVAGLVVISAVACVVPALRAVRVDPTRALRAE
jgi:putative ABC transport system permease protein